MSGALAETLRMWRLFRNEREDPEPFYRAITERLVDDLERRHGPLAGQHLLDLGCGPGHTTDALRERGATVLPVDNSEEEAVIAREEPVSGFVLADATNLPLEDAAVDGIVCSNLLEHTPDWRAVLVEMERVLRPGGWAYLSWTNWYSPHGGHLMSPFHFLGPRIGPRVHDALRGPVAKNAVGDGLWPVHIGPVLRHLRSRPGVTVTSVEPRYWPRARGLCAVPGLREVAAWNCVVRLRREAAPPLEPQVEGWLTEAQAARLAAAARDLAPGAAAVEIGSYRGRSAIVLARSVPPGCPVYAIDPHAGNDRGPQQWTGTEEEGQSDHEAFRANLARAGVADRVRHVREFSQRAHAAVPDPAGLVYVDGAHGYAPALADLRAWGDRVVPGGTLLVHDSFSSVGVTLALMRRLFLARDFRYLGRTGSLAAYRREPASPLRNLTGQAAELPWFARNLVLKALIAAGLRGGPWPY